MSPAAVLLRALAEGGTARFMKGRKTQVVLLGPSGSGKTRCLLALRNGKATATVPSLSVRL